MHIKVFIGINIFNPFIDGSQWPVICIFNMFGNVFRFFPDIKYCIFFNIHFFCKLFCRNPINYIRFFSRIEPCGETTF